MRHPVEAVAHPIVGQFKEDNSLEDFRGEVLGKFIPIPSYAWYPIVTNQEMLLLLQNFADRLGEEYHTINPLLRPKLSSMTIPYGTSYTLLGEANIIHDVFPCI